jgi:hypothetical protein
MRTTAHSIILACFGVPAAACYSPNQQLEATATGDESSPNEGEAGNATSSPSGTATPGDDSSSESAPGSSTGSDGVADESTGEALCGNGQLDGDEVCDDRVNDGAYGGCATDCNALGPHCGDGEIQAGIEGCDMGGNQATPACNAVCQIPGTILGTTTESQVTEPFNENVEGIRAVEQDRELVAVFGGHSTTYWRIDPGTLATNDIETTSAEGAMRLVSGIVDLGDGDLLVAGEIGSTFSNTFAFAVNEDLQVQWTWDSPPLPVPNNGFVGAAPLASGAILGGRHRGNSDFSSYWVTAASQAGRLLWSEIEVIDLDDDLYARDIRGLSTSDTVLLTDGLDGGATFRIYDTLGQTLITEELLALDSYRQLCVGAAGFYVFDAFNNLLAGFDNDGNPTVNIVGPSFSAGEQSLQSAECAALADGSPVISRGFRIDGVEWIRVSGFDQAEETWSTDLALPDGATTYDAPALVHVDEARHRVLVFMGGRLDADANLRFMTVTALAI